ncbi:hypothetical protein [uncultured Stenotrophomonas sp.]|uniref:hypothetical protein n=1 Tax=uncultured Stenotrophomonas sp. TaxID=165438 RepID=UPI0025E9DC99|nr:hypothetical protein [uncultured Stenotrophomonas sp.]
MDTFNLQEAQRLLAELQRVHAEFEELADAGDRHRTLSADELEQCRQRLISLKAHLKQRAATGTIDGSKRRLTRLEDAFYEPAIRKASANFSLRTNAPPCQWSSGLYNPSVDIAYLATQLEEMIREGV